MKEVFEIFKNTVRDFWKFYGPAIVVFVLMLVIVIVLKTITDLRATRVTAKEVKLWENKIDITAEDDSLVVRELGKLRENQILIIYTHDDGEVQIKRIPDDSLQYWADSLYNSPK